MMKRAFDVLLSFVALIILLPFLMIVAILIKLMMPGPVLFSQERVGLGGRRFRILKFRSMKINNSGVSITLKNDDRITPLGRFLRRSKIDELPQLWNILIGEMSFVGFRPDVPGYHDQLQGDQRLLLSIMPGLTGADSLAYPNEEDILQHQPDPQAFYDQYLFPDKVRINMAYMKKQSFLFDLKIIVYTLLQKKIQDPELLPKFS